MRNRKVFCDLDGVLCDFMGYVRYVLKTDKEWHEMDPKATWGELEKIPNLFMQPMWLPGTLHFYNNLWNLVKNGHGLELEILTALPIPTGHLKTAKEDKIEWVRRYVCREVVVNCSDGWKGKTKFLQPGDILIDDMRRNIDAWVAAGGVGIHHVSQEKTLEKLRANLET